MRRPPALAALVLSVAALLGGYALLRPASRTARPAADAGRRAEPAPTLASAARPARSGASMPVRAPRASQRGAQDEEERAAEQTVAAAHADIARRICRWTGVVRNADGTPIGGPARLELRGGAGSVVVAVAADGGFDVRVPAGGRYEATLKQPEGDHRFARPVTCDGERLEEDLHLTGARVRLTVRDAATGALLEDPDTQGVWIARPGAEGRFVRFEKGGTTVLDGMSAGPYALRGWPRPVHLAGSGALAFDVGASDLDVALDLEVDAR